MLQDKQAKEEERKGGQQAELNRPKRGCPASGLGSCGVATGGGGGDRGRQRGVGFNPDRWFGEMRV
jgi:hypothetical protein